MLITVEVIVRSSPYDWQDKLEREATIDIPDVVCDSLPLGAISTLAANFASELIGTYKAKLRDGVPEKTT